MALVKSALFDSIQGSVKNVTFRKRRNKKIELGKKHVPFDPESTAQLRSDAGYTRLAELYRTATWPDWERYDELSSLAKISRWNAWVEWHMPAMSRGPVAYWGFAEDEEAILHDFTKNDNNGNIVGATWVPEGLYFDGINDYVDCGTSIQVPTFSISLWTKFDGLYRMPLIVKYINVLNLDFILSTGSGSTLFGGLKVDGVDEQTGTYTINAGQWYHIVLTFDGPNLRLWIDGTNVRSNTSMTLSPANAGTIYIGYQPNWFGYGARYFNGTINEVAIYNRALTESEIKALYEAGKTRLGVR